MPIQAGTSLFLGIYWVTAYHYHRVPWNPLETFYSVLPSLPKSIPKYPKGM